MQATGSFTFPGHGSRQSATGRSQSKLPNEKVALNRFFARFVCFLILFRLLFLLLFFIGLCLPFSTRLDCRAFPEGEFIAEYVTGAGCMGIRKPNCFMWQRRFITSTPAAFGSNTRSAFVKKSLHWLVLKTNGGHVKRKKNVQLLTSLNQTFQ